jgi:hypothetical protein
MPVTISYHAGLREGVNWRCRQRVLGRRRHDCADERRSVAPPMNSRAAATLGRAVRPRRRFLVTVMVQIISRIDQPRRTP